MGVHRPPGRAVQPRLKPDIEPLDDRIDVPDTGRETIEDAGLALAAMRDEGADVRLRLGDRRAMGRPIDRVTADEQFVERGQVGGHVPVRRRYHARRPAHHMVAAEQDAGVGQREAKVVRGVAGGVDRLETPTLPGDDIAIAHRHIRSEIPVPAFFDPGLAAPASGMRAVTPDRRTRRRLQCCGRRRMVAMRVSDQDVRHTLRRETGEQGLHMLGEVGAWVDHRNLAAADHVGAGAPEGEWAGVARGETECRRPCRKGYTRSSVRHSGSRDIFRWRRRLVEMKIKLDIDCTPDEVRDFFGLPQVKPLQEELLKEVQERLSANIKAMDPEAMLKTWLPATLKGFEQLQEMFLSRMGGAGGKRK